MDVFFSPYAHGIAPKVYVGLFGDNAIGVLDTACNHVPVPL